MITLLEFGFALVAILVAAALFTNAVEILASAKVAYKVG